MEAMTMPSVERPEPSWELNTAWVVAAFSALRALTMTSKLDSGTALCSLKGTLTTVSPGKEVSLRTIGIFCRKFGLGF